jgi:hypothetical protein
MRINSPYITGSATITGDLCVNGTIFGTITGVASTASYALNAETLDGLDSTQFIQTGSFNSYTSSASSSVGDLSGSIATTTSNLSSSIGSLSSSVATTTSGLAGRITTVEGNYATTGSNIFSGTQTITGSFNQLGDMCVTGNITSTGQIIAQTINVQQVTSSIVYSCGSNTFGCSLTNNQVLTGSVYITGSNIFANVNSTCFSGEVRSPQVQINTSINCGKLNIIGYDNDGINIIDQRTSGAGCYYSSITFRDYYMGESAAIRFHHNQGIGSSIASLRFVLDGSEKFLLTPSGIACFSGTVCTPRLQVFNTNSIVVIEGTATNGEGTLTIAGKNSGGTSRSAIFKYDNADLIRIATADAIPMRFETSDVTRMTIASTGIVCFACQVCAPVAIFTGCVGVGTTTPLTTFTVKSTNDNGYALTRPTNADAYHWRLSTTETGTDAYTVRYNTFNNEAIFSTYAAGGTGGHIYFRTSASGGSGTESNRLTITPSGTATFACSVTTNNSLIIQGDSAANNSQSCIRFVNLRSGTWSNAQIEVETGGQVWSGNLVFKTASNDFANVLSERMRITSSGVVQIRSGNSLAVYREDNTRALEFYTTANETVINSWEASSEPLHIRSMGTGGRIQFFTCSSERLRISPSGFIGIGCTNPTAPLTIRCDASSQSAIMEIATCFQNAYRYASINAGAGISYCIPGGTSQSPFFEVQGGDLSAGGGSFRIRTGAMGSVTDKVNIAQNGVACFASTVCAPNFVGNITNSSSEIRVCSYFHAKYIPEAATQAMFSVITNGASATYVQLVGTNPGVGWSSSQIYHASNSGYWGGYVGSGTSVSTTGTGAFITSISSNNAGTQTYNVTNANNGTGTSTLVWVYVTTVTYGGYSTSFTAL